MQLAGHDSVVWGVLVAELAAHPQGCTTAHLARVTGHSYGRVAQMVHEQRGQLRTRLCGGKTLYRLAPGE